MNENKLSHYKSILENEMKELVPQLDALEKDKTRKKGHLSADSSEQAIEIGNDEVIDGLENLEINKLNHITAALERLKTGTFGLCSACGEEVSESRLDAIPYADKCINCS